MIHEPTLAQCFAGLIGFRQTQSKDITPIDASLLNPTSGRYYQDFHPLLTLENLYTVAPRFTDYTDYTFSAWLQEKISASRQTLFHSLLQKYKLEQAGKSILNSLKLYEGSGSYTDKIIKQDRLVGFEINSQTYRDVEILINGIGLQLDTVNPEMKLYLYSDTELKQTITINANVKTFFGWYDISPINFQGGTFYLLYNEAELLGQAISRQSDLNKAPCMGCGSYNHNAYKSWSEYFDIKPVSFSNTVNPWNGGDWNGAVTY